ncbi:hypothetical protein ATANTOWER_027893, partial [Ataeniobius toweri]|nr:hypothetical protein [Ataeniobius toweri]
QEECRAHREIRVRQEQRRRISSEEDINQGRSSRREEEEIESHQKQRYQQHGVKRRFAATSAGQAAAEGFVLACLWRRPYHKDIA